MNILNLHQEKLVEKIVHFINNSSGLTLDRYDELSINIRQLSDGKSLSLHINNLKDVILRKDSQKRNFIQIDFVNGLKILLTQLLIGFKPYPVHGLDMREVPKVVTTPDLYKVFQAIEETLSLDGDEMEVHFLIHIFRSILKGGEIIGFDLKNERFYFHHLSYFTASA